MADQVTAAQFAQEIKKKYPQYAKVPDDQLAQAMVKKYPQYAKQVTFGAPSGAQTHDTISAKPKLSSGKGIKSAVYTAIDRALPFLPAAGATIGGLAAGPETGFVASVPAAAAGAGTGELLREQLNHAIFGEDLPGVKEEATNVGEQAALGGASEFGARGSGKVIGKVLKPFAEAAPTVKAAKAGVGVRMTPGEAAGSSTMKRIEELLGHMPGATGPMEHFRAAQIADAERMMTGQLEQLSPTRLADEQAGQTVHQALQKTAGGRTADINTKYDEVKKLLGVDPKTYMTPEQIDEAVAKKVKFYKDMGGGSPKVVQALAEARRAAASPKSAMAERLLKTPPEEVVSTVQRKMTLAQLREFNQVVPEPARRQVQANLLEKMLSESSDPQSGVLDQRVLAKALKRLGTQRGEIIFGNQWKALNEGSALLNKIAPMASNQTGGLGKMHAMRMLIEAGAVAGSALAFSGHAAAGAAAVAGPTAAMRMISLALAHPETSAMMLKILRGITVTGARSIPYGVDALAINPADYTPPNYPHTATHPATGHRVGSHDGQHWVDAETGAAVQ
jgi:hypothetical protein